MRLALVALSVLAAGACSESSQPPSALGYHRGVGLKEAERIRSAELQLLSGELGTRIVGGAVAPVAAHPYLAGIIIDLLGVTGNSVCGGSLITANRVLTAAHCWFDGTSQAWRFTVVLGSQYLFLGGGGTRIATSQVVMHPQWTPSTIAQDVAMIYLPTSVLFSGTISPISLPSGSALWEDFSGDWVVASGYGRTNDQLALTTSTLVSQVALQVITNQQCRASFTSYVLDSNICTSGAGGVGICGGDSGGPLLTVRNGAPLLIGVSSFVARAGCQLGFPSVFARVTSFLNFIYQHL